MSWWNGDEEGPACLVCGGRWYEQTRVLWAGLIEEWELSQDEAAFIDRQQGVRCKVCRCNLRSISLAGGICDTACRDDSFQDWLGSQPTLRALEINPAGDLTAMLGSLDHLTRASFPETDMTHLPFEEGSFDLVVHSDTLEHVHDPNRGLKECRRVLAVGGWLAMTVPTVPGRLTRFRTGMPPSYHGGEGQDREDHLVHTEFGADAWAMLAAAGFERIGCRVFAWPSGVCWLARR